MKRTLLLLLLAVFLLPLLAVIVTGPMFLPAADRAKLASGMMFGTGVLMFLAVAYFLPLIVALIRNHRNAFGVGVLNIFLGWTLIGWIIALVWASYKEKA